MVINSTGQPVVGGTSILDSVFNAFTADVATAISTCIMKDGQQTVTANIPFNGFKLTGVGPATARTDAATLASIQDGTGVYVSTVGGTGDAITLTPSPAITAYVAGQVFWFKAAATNTTAVTIAVNGLAAKAVQINGGALVAGDMTLNRWYRIQYDGAAFQLENLSSEVPPFTDTNALIKGSGDGTKKLRFEVDGLTTGTTRVITVPDIDFSLPGTAGTGISISTVTIAKIDETQMLENVGFTAAVAGNALTFTLTQKDGTALGAGSSAARIAFRNATLTTGQWSSIAATSGTTLTIPSGQAVGTVNGISARLYLCAINNAGSLELAVWNPLNATGPTLLGVNESGVVTTTAIATAPSAQVLYSTTARTNVAVRVVGYIEISEATAGTWATAPTVVQIMGPGVNRTGNTVQIQLNTTGAVASGTTTVTYSDAVPQNTYGDQYMSQAITPMSALNRLHIEHLGQYLNTGPDTQGMVMLFQDATANALATTSFINHYASTLLPFVIYWDMAAGTTSSTTFKIRAGGSSGTTVFNGSAVGTRLFGGTANSILKVTEVFQ